MITFIQRGDIFESNCEAITNTVNCVGVMGKGLALEFKRRYPDYFKWYREACKEGLISIGHVSVYTLPGFGNLKIVSFPTKTDWKYPSQLSWINAGLLNLEKTCLRLNIKSIAIPALGCSNGGLSWKDVKPLISARFEKTEMTVEVYEPL
jgi:O-acetyl-ADP-ribose deacetylase (regulator of RNase III)